MSALFADTSAFVAFLNKRDEYHDAAMEYLTRHDDAIVTTAWVLVELGNFLAKGRGRRRFTPFVRDLRREPHVEIVEANGKRFEASLALYARRPDKEWSMTDCLSFVVMEEKRLTEALTADHHFEQAGFTVLLK